MRRLEAALQQARKEQAAALRGHGAELDLIAAAPPQQRSAAMPPPVQPAPPGAWTGAMPGGERNASTSPAYREPPPAASQHQHPAAPYATHAAAPHDAFAWTTSAAAPSPPASSYAPSESRGQQGWQAAPDFPHGRRPQQPYGAHPPTGQQWRSDADPRASYAAPSPGSSPGSGAFSHGGPTSGPAPPSGTPLQPWQQAAADGGRGGRGAAPSLSPYEWHDAGDAEPALASQFGGLGLRGATPPRLPTPSFSASPFGTEDTLQVDGRLGASQLRCLQMDGCSAASSAPCVCPQLRALRRMPRCLQSMLAQTAALEGQLMALNAERQQLQAESSRMPTHTTGRTQQVGAPPALLDPCAPGEGVRRGAGVRRWVRSAHRFLAPAGLACPAAGAPAPGAGGGPAGGDRQGEQQHPPAAAAPGRQVSAARRGRRTRAARPAAPPPAPRVFVANLKRSITSESESR